MFQETGADDWGQMVTESKGSEWRYDDNALKYYRPAVLPYTGVFNGSNDSALCCRISCSQRSVSGSRDSDVICCQSFAQQNVSQLRKSTPISYRSEMRPHVGLHGYPGMKTSAWVRVFIRVAGYPFRAPVWNSYRYLDEDSCLRSCDRKHTLIMWPSEGRLLMQILFQWIVIKFYYSLCPVSEVIDENVLGGIILPQVKQ